MKNIKKILGLLIVVLGVFWYACQPTSRSLYSTKADASTEYTLIGQVGESLDIAQTFIPENSSIQKIEVLVNAANKENNPLVFQVETSDGQSLITGNGKVSDFLNVEKTKLVFSLDNVSFKAGQSYRLKISGQTGGMFYQTTPRFSNQVVTFNQSNREQALVLKTVYNGLHLQTFLVLLGLIAYIVLFMSVMLKLFR